MRSLVRNLTSSPGDVGADHVVAVQHATAEHGGKRLDIAGGQLMTVQDGRIASVRGHYSDQYALDEFWS